MAGYTSARGINNAGVFGKLCSQETTAIIQLDAESGSTSW